MYPDRTSLQRSDANVPECHRPVIGLQEQVAARVLETGKYVTV